MKNILVTGSSGLIGTRLCEFLLKEGFNVIGVDCVSNKWQTRINDLTINIDLRDKNGVMENLPKNIDMIIHLAANARVYDLIEKPQLAMDNFSTLFNILEFARVNNIEKLIFSSSREV
jgi:UDP-glucose 4-epimerase